MPGLFFAHTVHQTAERDPGRQPVEWRNGQAGRHPNGQRHAARAIGGVNP